MEGDSTQIDMLVGDIYGNRIVYCENGYIDPMDTPGDWRFILCLELLQIKNYLSSLNP